MQRTSLRRRLAAPTAAAAVAVLVSALCATGASGSGVEAPRSGFDGPIAAAPRALDRDLESPGAPLRSVACVGAPAGTACWIGS